MPENTDTSTPLRTHKRRQGQRLTKQERAIAQETFLKSFSLTANIRAACVKANIDRATVYAWQEHDLPFSILFKQAELDANDMIRAELFRRAVQGVEKPVVSVGRMVYEETPMLDSKGKPMLDSKGKPIMLRGKPLMVREYSDNLLSLLAKARMPEFRDKSVTVNVALPKEYINLPEDGVTE